MPKFGVRSAELAECMGSVGVSVYRRNGDPEMLPPSRERFLLRPQPSPSYGGREGYGGQDGGRVGAAKCGVPIMLACARRAARESVDGFLGNCTHR
jgi:hypothetical protein